MTTYDTVTTDEVSLPRLHHPLPTAPLPTAELRVAVTAGRDPVTAETPPTGSRWRTRYKAGLVAIDTGVAFVGACVAALLGTGAPAAEVISLILVPLGWFSVLALARAYEPRLVGVGSEELRRVLVAGATAVAIPSVLVAATGMAALDRVLALALPIACVGSLVLRYALRAGLHAQRAHGACTDRTVLVGQAEAVADFVRLARRSRHHGLHVIGAFLPPGSTDTGLRTLHDLRVPVLGSLDQVVDGTIENSADAVAILPTPQIGPLVLSRLQRDLERTPAELLVASHLVEVMGPRVSVHPVCGMPLLHVGRPETQGSRRWVKHVVERGMAAAVLLLLAPLLLVVSLAILLDDGGPVLFRQRRVGKDGHEFTMLKFRTMHRDAERRVTELVESNEGFGVLFKMRSDPRITRVGRRLRRYSIDELPQLFNVVFGQMSLVGPRPALPAEVAQYPEDVRRRLLVKPGLTGLWQVSGRSDLSWDETVRLDLRYVENWSLPFDMAILWKTAFAVLGGRGAY